MGVRKDAFSTRKGRKDYLWTRLFFTTILTAAASVPAMALGPLGLVALLLFAIISYYTIAKWIAYVLRVVEHLIS